MYKLFFEGQIIFDEDLLSLLGLMNIAFYWIYE